MDNRKIPWFGEKLFIEGVHSGDFVIMADLCVNGKDHVLDTNRTYCIMCGRKLSEFSLEIPEKRGNYSWRGSKSFLLLCYGPSIVQVFQPLPGGNWQVLKADKSTEWEKLPPMDFDDLVKEIIEKYEKDLERWKKIK